MLLLRRLLLASLLTGLVTGCHPKNDPGRSDDAKPGHSEDAKSSNHTLEKFKKIQAQPEGPPFRPK
jgi:hypothetical protein